MKEKGEQRGLISSADLEMSWGLTVRSYILTSEHGRFLIDKLEIRKLRRARGRDW